MPPNLGQPHRSVSWNCDRDTDELVPVVLYTPPSGTATFRLCRPCYDSTLPHVVALAAAGIVITLPDG